jgi:C4-dicarboxylate-binding protein DctP
MPMTGRRTVLLAALVGGISIAVPAQAQDTVNLRFSADSPPTNIKVEAQMKWSELAKEKSGGRLNIRVFPNAQLYNDMNAIPAVSSGTVDMAAPPSTLLTSVVPESAVFELPSLWGVSYQQYRELLAGEFGRDLEKQYEDKLGVKVIGYYNIGSWIWAAKGKALVKPEDFAGQKLRIVGNPLVEEVLQGLGAVPTQVAWPEVPTALVQGVIDGLETTLSGYTSAKGWELTNNLTFSNHKFLPYVVIINKAAWDRIPADLQAVMVEAFEESRAWHDGELEDRNEGMLASFRDNGVSVHMLEKAELDAIVEAAMPAEESYLASTGLGDAAASARRSVGR